MSELSKTAPSVPERPRPLPVNLAAASSDHPTPTPAEIGGPMGALELAAYRADWRASLQYRRHIAEVSATHEHGLLVKRLEADARLAAEKVMRAAGKRVTAAAAEARKTVARNSSNQHQDQDDEDESLFARRRSPPPSHPITPARAAARLILARLFDARPELRDAIRTSGPVVLVDVPDPQMLDRVLGTWQDTLFPPETPARVMKVGTHHSESRDDYDLICLAVKEPPKAKEKGERQNEALSALSLALPLIAISPAAETHLPEALLKSRPVRLTFPPLDAVTITRAIRLVTGKRCRELLDAESCARITPADLVIAIRFDRAPAECMAELRRLAAEKSVRKSGRDISLNEMHGMDEAVAWARSTIRDLEAWRRGEIPWAALDPGACLVGPPGTGKTLFAESFARAAGLPLVACSLAQWQSADEGHLGHLLRAMRRDFEMARSQTPCVMFIDEIDSFADRGKVRHDHADYVIEVVNGFIAQLDGAAGREGLIFLAASNDVSRCDPAILRSGRLNRIIRIKLPDAQDLSNMFRVRLAGRLADEDLSEICLLAVGSTGADVERITNDALRFARHAERPLEVGDLRRALVDREDRSPSELRRAAVHEAGHLLTEILLFGRESEVHATIAKSGARGGATIRTPALSLAGTYSEYHRCLQVLLAGRAAEEIVIGEPSHGAASDLQQATAIAAAMIGSFGIAGPDLLLSLARSEETQELLAYADVRVAARDELTRASEACRAALVEHRAALDEIASTLLQAGLIDGVRAAAILVALRCNGIGEGTGHSNARPVLGRAKDSVERSGARPGTKGRAANEDTP